MDGYDDDMPMMAPTMERDASGFAPQGSGQMPVPYGGAAVIIQSNRDTTAKKVAVERDPAKVFSLITRYANMFGDQFVYAWDAKDKRTGRKTRIEGPTIKLANTLARSYGNCHIGCDVSETATHLIFKAVFVDYESGLSTERLFQQRKNQNTGMGDVDRQADIIFQIGQSKAIRNVIVNALSDFATHGVEEAKKGMLKMFESEEKRTAALDFIDRALERYEVSPVRLEAIVGRRRKDWTIPNLAHAYSTMRAIVEGIASVSDAFPTEDTAKEIEQERAEDDAALKKREGRTVKPKPEAKQETAKADYPVDSTAMDRIIFDFGTALDFETIEAIRAEAAALDIGKTPVVLKAYDEARKRVKAANAEKAKPKPADETRDEAIARHRTEDAAAADDQRATAGDPEIDEEDVLARIEGMLEGLTTTADVEAAWQKLLPGVNALSEGGESRALMMRDAALHFAKAKQAEVKPGPSSVSMLFTDE